MVIGLTTSLLSTNYVLFELFNNIFYCSRACSFVRGGQELRNVSNLQAERKEIFTRQVKTARGGGENRVWVPSLPLKRHVCVEPASAPVPCTPD